MTAMDVRLDDSITFYPVKCSPSAVTNWGWQSQTDGRVVRFVRGTKCKNVLSLFDEFSAALQFPYYFGENWNAFNECITDLDWLDARSFVLVVLDAAALLMDEPESSSSLMRILRSAR